MSTKPNSLSIILFEKLGNVKSTIIKDYKESELYKKCGFKKPEHFAKQSEWNIPYEGTNYTLTVYGKKEGRANTENKYEFPPPLDKTLLFGTCCAVLKRTGPSPSASSYINLTVVMWAKIYETLFGGFEDLSTNILEDEYDEDELKHVSIRKKTKHGYLKDGFTVDSDEEEDDVSITSISGTESTAEQEESLIEMTKESDDLELDLGSELSEESYEVEPELE
jgi:hypothetical protein